MSEKDASSTPKAQSTVRLALWLTFLAFLLIIAVFHAKISEIHFDSQGVSAKMSNSEEVSKLTPEDRKAASDDLAQRVSVLEKDARGHADAAKPAPAQEQAATAPEQPATAPITEATYQQPAPVQQASLPNIAGTWGSPIGVAYVVQQYGNYVLITEVSQGVVTAAAGGTISGWSFSLPSQNILSHAGVLTLNVSADQRHMTGQYMDSVTGQVSAMYLNR